MTADTLGPPEITAEVALGERLARLEERMGNVERKIDECARSLGAIAGREDTREDKLVDRLLAAVEDSRRPGPLSAALAKILDEHGARLGIVLLIILASALGVSVSWPRPLEVTADPVEVRP